MPLRDVLVDELRDMYSAESQLVKALPKLAKGAKNTKLKELFTAHLEETEGQVERLKEVFEHLDEKPTGEHCDGMEGIVEEGKSALEALPRLWKFPSGVLSSSHIAPNALVEREAVVGIIRISLSCALKIGKGHIVIAGEISLSARGELTPRPQSGATGKDNNP